MLRALGVAGLLVVTVFVVGCSAVRPSGPDGSPTPEAAALIVLARGGVAHAAWSPDGSSLLVKAGDPSSLSVFDASGRLLRVLDADAATWIAPKAMLVWAHGMAHEETVDGKSVPLQSPPPIEGVTNGHGAFAYPTTEAGPDAQFAVWTGQGTTGEQRGVPIGWSSDGTRLVVWHPTEPVTGPTARGSLDILDWPSLRIVATAGEHLVGRGPAPVFDPSGRYVAFFSESPAILDLTSAVVKVTGAHTASDGLAWDANGNLRYPSADGEVVAVSATGDRAGDGIAGEAVAAAASGALVVIYTPQADTSAEMITPAGTATVVLPGPIEPLVAVAPDGSAVVFTCAVNGGDELVLVRR